MYGTEPPAGDLNEGRGVLGRQWPQSEARASADRLGQPVEAEASPVVPGQVIGDQVPASAEGDQAVRFDLTLRLGEIVSDMAELRHHRDSDGKNLNDLTDAELPGPEAPALVRLLPAFDNALLCHADPHHQPRGPKTRDAQPGTSTAYLPGERPRARNMVPRRRHPVPHSVPPAVHARSGGLGEENVSYSSPLATRSP